MKKRIVFFLFIFTICNLYINSIDAASLLQYSEYQPHKSEKNLLLNFFNGEITNVSLGIQQEGFRTDYLINSNDTKPYDLVLDDQNNLWFSDFNDNILWKMNLQTENLTGIILPEQIHPFKFFYAGNNILWFTDYNYDIPSGSGNIVKFNTSSYDFHLFPVPTINAAPFDLVVSNNVVWFTEWQSKKIGKIDLTSNTTTEFNVLCKNDFCGPLDINVDKDGNIWYVDTYSPAFIKIDLVDGNQHRINLPSTVNAPVDIEFGSDGLIWTGDHGGDTIVSYNPNLEEFNIYTSTEKPEASFFTGINDLGLDNSGNIWFVEHFTNQFGQFNIKTKTITEYYLPRPDPQIQWLYTNHNMGEVWYAEWETGIIGRIQNSQALYSNIILNQSVIDVNSLDSPNIPLSATIKIGMKNISQFEIAPIIRDEFGYVISSTVSSMTIENNSGVEIQFNVFIKDELPLGTFYIPIGISTDNFTSVTTLRIDNGSTVNNSKTTNINLIYSFSSIIFIWVIKKRKKIDR